MSIIYVDWSNIWFTKSIDFNCPLCDGKGYIIRNNFVMTKKECDLCYGVGILSPMINVAYSVECKFTKENRIIAANNGLFLFKMPDGYPDEDEIYMSLMGGGMDLSYQIATAYYELRARIPLELLVSFDLNFLVQMLKGNGRDDVLKWLLDRYQIYSKVFNSKALELKERWDKNE